LINQLSVLTESGETRRAHYYLDRSPSVNFAKLRVRGQLLSIN
jgi:hypothetical protein